MRMLRSIFMGYLLVFSILIMRVELYSQMQELNSGVSVQLNSSTNCKPYYYSFMGWACGNNGTIIKGMGNNWRNLTGNGVPTNVTLNNIYALDTMIAWVCGSTGTNTGAWKTTNGGMNWIQIFSQTNGFINAVFMKNYLLGFMEGNPVGGRWSLWKTTNGGLNWDSSGLYLPQSGSETGWSNSLCMTQTIPYISSPDSNKIWFSTNNYRIYYSSNYGQSWSVQSTSPEQNSFCPVLYNGVLYAGGSNFVLYTTNYGFNWTTQVIGGSGNISISRYFYSSIYAIRGDKFYTGNQGTWNPAYTAPAGTYIYVNNYNSGNFFDYYAVRSNGGITFYAPGEGVKKISGETPTKYSLSQNYPNPFNPVTKINYDITKSSFVQLKVFDAAGHQIAQLVNEQQTPGTYEAEFDGSGYASGVYFYKLISDPETSSGLNFSETKKMVLIK